MSGSFVAIEKTLLLKTYDKNDIPHSQSDRLLSDKKISSIYTAGASRTLATTWKEVILLLLLWLEAFTIVPVRTISDVSGVLQIFLYILLFIQLLSKSFLI